MIVRKRGRGRGTPVPVHLKKNTIPHSPEGPHLKSFQQYTEQSATKEEDENNQPLPPQNPLPLSPLSSEPPPPPPAALQQWRRQRGVWSYLSIMKLIEWRKSPNPERN